MGVEKIRRKFVGKGQADARGGLYSAGVPVFGSPGMMCSGTVFHVSSTGTGASDDNSGLSPDQALATIDAAINKCTANKGDLIVVHENHAETILTDAAIDCDVAGISIVGLGQGASRPTITMGATATGASTAATVEINAANVRLENLLFLAGIDALVKAVHVIGDDFSLVNCEFREASGKQMLIAVNVGAANNDADRCKILGNKFVSVAAGATSAISLTQLQDAVEIVGNYIDGDYSDAGIQNPTGEICTNLLLQDNIVSNRSTGNHAIQLVSACTGLAVGNMMYGDTLGTILDPGSLKCLDNKETDAIDQAGVDSPRTSAGGFPDASITAAVFAAGAIDAAAVGVGAIAADAFAAGAIDAAAIANGAIDAATFAAGAIDAAAIANSAIDAATFAAGAIDAAAIADGAVDRATFAADTGLQTIRSNTAQAGAAGTITLDASASASDDFYNNAVVLITGGTGVGQARLVSDYTGATKVADVIPNWVTTPDNTSTFAVLPSGLVRVGSFATGAIVAGAFAAGAIDDTAVAAGAISEIGTITNTGGTATIGAVLGDLANDSLVARLNDIGTDVNGTTTDTIQGKLGTDTEMADRSVYDLLNGGGPAAAAAAAAPANDVSLYGAVRAVYDRQLGDGTNTNANSKLGKKVTKAAADIIDGTQKALFTVSGGRVLLTSLSVETAVAAIAAGLCNVKFRTNPTVGTDMDLSANLDIDGDEVGSLYSLSGIVTDATTGGSGGGAMAMQRPIIVAEGTIDLVSSSDGGSGGATGVSELWYFPLDNTASVAAA